MAIGAYSAQLDRKQMKLFGPYNLESRRTAEFSVSYLDRKSS